MTSTITQLYIEVRNKYWDCSMVLILSGPVRQNHLLRNSRSVAPCHWWMATGTQTLPTPTHTLVTPKTIILHTWCAPFRRPGPLRRWRRSTWQQYLSLDSLQKRNWRRDEWWRDQDFRIVGRWILFSEFKISIGWMPTCRIKGSQVVGFYRRNE